MSKISKIDAAQRLLDEAIQLWIDDRDALAILTLTMAAFRTLDDLCKHANLHPKDNLTEQFYKKYRKLGNFVKHADRDPSSSAVEMPIEMHEVGIGLSLVMYRMIVGDLTPEMGAFHRTMLHTYPEKFRIAPDPDPDIEEASQFIAGKLRQDVRERRRDVQLNLNIIRDGITSANANWKRVQ